MITTSKPSLITPNLVWGAKYRRKSERNVEVNDVPLGVNTCIFQVIDLIMYISEKLCLNTSPPGHCEMVFVTFFNVSPEVLQRYL